MKLKLAAGLLAGSTLVGGLATAQETITAVHAFPESLIEARDAHGSPHIVGDMGTGAFDPGRQMEIGIVLDPAWQGRGIATRACRMMFDHLFANGLHRVTARIDPRNGASLRLFERLGFRQEGIERSAFWDEDWQEWTDEVCFAVLASEWSGLAGG